MQIQAETPDDYVDQLPADRKDVISKLRNLIKDNLPKGFVETINYGMIGYVVPHSIYPGGYHCNPKEPLPFMGLASQKNHIGFYHMGLYADKELMSWFTAEYPKHSSVKLDMGKSCIRFKKPEHIPFDLIARLVRKVEIKDWIACYEANIKR